MKRWLVTMKRWLVTTKRWLVIVALLGCAVAAAEAAELEELRGAIRDSRDRVGQHEATERALLEQVEDVERRLESLNAQVAEARAEASAARSELERIEQQTDSLARQLEKTRRSLARRAVALYKQGSVGAVRVLFSADSLGEMLSRWGSLRTLVRTDAALAERFQREHEEHEAALVEVAAAAERSSAAALQLSRHSRELAAERAHKRKLVARVHKDRVSERAYLVELERAARTLEETLGALGDRAGAEAAPVPELDASFEQLRGSLPPPVIAPLRRGFGRVVDARFQTETFRRGIEFAAQSGDSVRAVAPGVVRFEGWFRGYGKIVVLDHGADFFTVSGHLSAIYVTVGQPVKPGEALGAVGETGSLSGPGLYFEIRRGARPLDPADWLSLPGGTRESA